MVDSTTNFRTPFSPAVGGSTVNLLPTSSGPPPTATLVTSRKSASGTTRTLMSGHPGPRLVLGLWRVRGWTALGRSGISDVTSALTLRRVSSRAR